MSRARNGFVAREIEVGGVVIRGEEDGPAVVSALCDMMGEAGEDDAGDARHGEV